MITKPSYLVIDTDRIKPTIVRVTQTWPTLGPGEIAVRIQIEISDSIQPLYKVPVTRGDSILEAMSVPAEEPDDA